MFLYVTGVKTEAEAGRAVKMGANAIGVELAYRKSALEAENCRTWLENLPFQIMKSGIFESESYYDVEEMASFCHLDIIHLTSLEKAGDFSRHSGRVIVETKVQDYQDLPVSGFIIRLSEPDELKKLAGFVKPVLLTGDFTPKIWRQILACYEPAGLALDFKALNEDFLKLINNR